jgi:hypothetical protein
LRTLTQLNTIKTLLKDIEVNSSELPEEIQEDFKDILVEIRGLVNQAGSIVEKYFDDEETFENMKRMLENKMKSISIYDGLDKSIKDTIVDRVIRSKDLNLLTEDQLREFIEDRLKTSSVEDLVKKSYSKYDIIKLGEAVETIEASESKKYNAGLGVLRGLVSTPKGREEAIGHGVEKLMKDATSRRYYIALYYGLTKSR